MGRGSRNQAAADWARRDCGPLPLRPGKRRGAHPGGRLRTPRRGHRHHLYQRLWLPCSSRRADVVRGFCRPEKRLRAHCRISSATWRTLGACSFAETTGRSKQNLFRLQQGAVCNGLTIWRTGICKTCVQRNWDNVSCTRYIACSSERWVVYFWFVMRRLRFCPQTTTSSPRWVRRRLASSENTGLSVTSFLTVCAAGQPFAIAKPHNLSPKRMEERGAISLPKLPLKSSTNSKEKRCSRKAF